MCESYLKYEQLYCNATDVKKRCKEVLNQMCFSMHLFRFYSETSLVAELIFGVVVADYIM